MALDFLAGLGASPGWFSKSLKLCVMAMRLCPQAIAIIIATGFMGGRFPKWIWDGSGGQPDHRTEKRRSVKARRGFVQIFYGP